MSYAEDNFHDLDPEFLGLCLYGSDFDLDTMRGGELAWECKNGDVIAINDMTTSHIKNCIAMIKRSVANDKPWRLYYLEPLLEELKNRKLFEALKNISDEEFNNIIQKAGK